MNKYDIKLIIGALFISLLLLLYFKSNDSSYAYVYYDSKLVKTINLNSNNEYEIDGYNGKVLLEVKSGKLRVKEENSPLHICSKQGFTNSGSIVCLPNKIVISFKDDLDTRTG